VLFLNIEEVMEAGPVTEMAPPLLYEPAALLSDRVEDTMIKPAPVGRLTFTPPPSKDVAVFPEMIEERIMHDADVAVTAYMYNAPPDSAVFDSSVDEMMLTVAVALVK